MTASRAAFGLFAGAVLLAGCSSSRKTDPGILTTEPYNRIRYVAEAPPGTRELGRVEVSRRAEEASIRSTLPALYEKGIELGGRYISGIAVKTVARKELFDVPYESCRQAQVRRPKRECKTEYRSQSEYRCEYVGGKRQCGSKLVQKPVQACTTVYTTETRKQCTTTYKKELAWVLYQTAGGMIHGEP